MEANVEARFQCLATSCRKTKDVDPIQLIPSHLNPTRSSHYVNRIVRNKTSIPFAIELVNMQIYVMCKTFCRDWQSLYEQIATFFCVFYWLNAGLISTSSRRRHCLRVVPQGEQSEVPAGSVFAGCRRRTSGTNALSHSPRTIIDIEGVRIRCKKREVIVVL